MEEPVKNTKNYELAIHLGGDLTEAEFKKQLSEIETKINNNGGAVIKTSDGNKTRLTYPVKKQRTSDFFWIDFSAPATNINEITKELKTIGAITRSLITVKIREEQPPVLRKSFVPKAKPIPRTAEEKVEVKQEELDKRLEEILENI